jgi:hypothetical protein
MDDSRVALVMNQGDPAFFVQRYGLVFALFAIQGRKLSWME